MSYMVWNDEKWDMIERTARGIRVGDRVKLQFIGHPGGVVGWNPATRTATAYATIKAYNGTSGYGLTSRGFNRGNRSAPRHVWALDGAPFWWGTPTVSLIGGLETMTVYRKREPRARKG